jgi:hypothetical protein
MSPRFSKSTLGALLAAAFLLTQSSAHTWLEQLQVVDDQGKYAGAPGYPRGFVDRESQNPKFSDSLMSYLAPPNGAGRSKLAATDPLCHQRQRQPNSNTQDFPSLRAQAGNYVAMKYLENGHVTAPVAGKAGSGGLVYVYATSQPKPDETLANVLTWGPQGDLAQGRLLAINTYDDLRCYQINNANQVSVSRQQTNPDPIPGQPGSRHEQWCETNFQLPKDAAAGSLSVTWVWQWPTLPSMDPGLPQGKDEIYTTCSDVEIVADGNALKTAVGGKQVAGQDPQVSAVTSFKDRAANLTLPANPAFYGPGNSGNLSSPGQAPSQAPPQGPPSQAPPQGPPSPPQASPLPSQAPSQGAPAVPSGFIIRTSTTTVMVTVTATANGRFGRPAPTGAKFR